MTENSADSRSKEQHFGDLKSADSASKLILQRGSSKRSFSIFADIAPPEIPKRARPSMDEDMSGDEVDDNEILVDDMASSPSAFRVPCNFSSNCASTFRSMQKGTQGTKKLAIKNFRKRVDEVSYGPGSADWNALDESVKAVHLRQPITYSLEELYKKVVNVCEGEHADEMYSHLILLSRAHLVAHCGKLEAQREMPGADFLKLLESLWSHYCEQIMMIRNVFLHLDRTYILTRPSVPCIWEVSLNIFSEIIMDNSYVRERAIRELLTVIDAERGGDQVDRSLVRSLVRMFTNLRIYSQVFESAFLNATADLYRNEGRNLSRDLEISAYLRHVARRLDEENERVDVALDASTRKPLIATVESAFIVEHMQSVITRGMDALLQEDRFEDLALLYRLTTRVTDGLSMLKTHFAEYIKKNGKSIVMDPERDKDMVSDLMTFKEKLDRIVLECFDNNEKLGQAEKDSFDYFVNTRPNKPAELIAKFLDSKLRSGNKEASDEELDHMMDKIITLFRFIQGKDVFEAFYKKDLAKRLLLGRSASVDAEKAMLSKLKQECGGGFTHKLEGMFKDMELSKDLGVGFRQYTEHEQKDIRVDFNVNVLTTGSWPHYEFVELSLPAEMCSCLQLYQDYYVSKHSGRKLQWQHSLGHCLVKGTFRPGVQKELSVSLFQAVILLLFNEQDSFTYEEIAHATKIEKNELARTLQSLACAKIRLLIKTPKSRDVLPGDRFELNSQLQEKLYRIRVSQVQMKETEEEKHAVEEAVSQDRQYQIDAAVVRIMKTRKSLPHAQLISELFSQLRFPVVQADLKARIASLIERDYIARSPTDVNVYTYVA